MAELDAQGGLEEVIGSMVKDLIAKLDVRNRTMKPGGTDWVYFTVSRGSFQFVRFGFVYFYASDCSGDAFELQDSYACVGALCGEGSNHSKGGFSCKTWFPQTIERFARPE